MENASPPNNQIRLLSQGHAQPPRCLTARGEDRRSAEGCVRLKKEDLPALLPKILPGAEQIAYRVVTEGRCFVSTIGGEPIAVKAGEVILFTRGEPNVMSSSPGMRADPFAPGVIDAATRGQLPFCINFGGDGPTSAKLVCGFLACDAQPFNPLLENLPPVIKAGDRKDCNAGWVGNWSVRR
jgi:Cupin